MREQSMTRIQAALALAPTDAEVLANVSDAYATLGDHQQAIKYAHLSLQNGYTVADLRRDPDMKSVWPIHEFQAPTPERSK